MENALETTQRLVADHRNSLESAAHRDRLVKGDAQARRRPWRSHFGLRTHRSLTGLATQAHQPAA